MSHEVHIWVKNIILAQQQHLLLPPLLSHTRVTNYVYMSHELHVSVKLHESRSTYMSQKHYPRPTTASAPPLSVKSYVSHELRVYESQTTYQCQTTWVTKYTYESQTFTSPNNSSCSPLLWYVSPSSPLIASEAENCVVFWLLTLISSYFRSYFLPQKIRRKIRWNKRVQHAHEHEYDAHVHYGGHWLPVAQRSGLYVEYLFSIVCVAVSVAVWV